MARSTRSPKVLRGLYFALAALWGFVAGAVAVTAGVAMTGAIVEWRLPVVILVGLGGILAVGGAWVVSRAYSDVRHRR